MLGLNFCGRTRQLSEAVQLGTVLSTRNLWKCVHFWQLFYTQLGKLSYCYSNSLLHLTTVTLSG